MKIIPYKFNSCGRMSLLDEAEQQEKEKQMKKLWTRKHHSHIFARVPAVFGLLMLMLACSSTATSTSDSGINDEDAQGSDSGISDAGDQSVFDGSDGHKPDCSEYVFENVMIPMRDSKSLSAFVRRPAKPGCRLPTVLIQTPYDKEKARSIWFEDSEDEPLFSSTDYAFVVEDWRGFFGSKDAAVDSPQPYGQDGYDTVEWIAAQDWSDGNVGTWGVSALCVQQYRTAFEHPAHLKAAVPIFCQMNTTYEQYYPGGVLRQEYFDFISGYFGGGDIITNHPYHDLVWKGVERTYDASDIDVPMLVVSGWYDLYNTSTLKNFQDLRDSGAQPARLEHRLLVGPWIHAATGGETSGSRPLDQQEMNYYDSDKRIQSDSLAFFDMHLRTISSPADQWKAVHWITGGVRVEQDADSWPPPGTADRTYFLAPGGVLDTSAPSEETLTFGYDPDDPSPTAGGCTLRMDLKHGPRYQDDVISRADALVFTTAPLDSVLAIKGKVEVTMKVSTTGRDTDFAIRLTDVDEQGRHLLVGEGIRRLKLRDGFDRPVDIQPGQVYDITVTLTNEEGYNFAQGHRIGLIVTSSNYPRFARNPNNGNDFYQDEAGSVSVQNTIRTGNGTFLTLRI